MTTSGHKSSAVSSTVLSLMLSAAAVVLGIFSSGCNLEPTAPGQPTYEADVRPILMARCVRCHGAPDFGEDLGAGTVNEPFANRRFDLYEDTNCGAPDAGTVCDFGAKTSAPAIKAFTDRAQATGGMPPLPAPRLTSYQKETIDRWVANPIER